MPEERKEVIFQMDATTFPISFSYHLIFCIVACAFFVLQFIRQHRPHQLILAIGIAGSLLIYVNTASKTLFHTVGLFELVLLIGAIVLSVIARARNKREEAQKGTTDAPPSAEGTAKE